MVIASSFFNKDIVLFSIITYNLWKDKGKKASTNNRNTSENQIIKQI